MTYGEAHIMMGVRETIVEFLLQPDGSGSLVVKRGGVEISRVAWEPEKAEVVGLTQREKETL